MSRNERTPRTLADCSFAVGYSMADLREQQAARIERRAHAAIYVLAFVALALAAAGWLA